MSDYVLSCCSTADLAKEQFERRNIQYICFHYFLDNVEYADDLYTTMTPDAFYQAMVDGADTRTSQVNISEYLDYFTGFLEQGKDILHLTLSSGISGSIPPPSTPPPSPGNAIPSGRFISWTPWQPPPVSAF